MISSTFSCTYWHFEYIFVSVKYLAHFCIHTSSYCGYNHGTLCVLSVFAVYLLPLCNLPYSLDSVCWWKEVWVQKSNFSTVSTFLYVLQGTLASVDMKVTQKSQPFCHMNYLFLRFTMKFLSVLKSWPRPSSYSHTENILCPNTADMLFTFMYETWK